MTREEKVQGFVLGSLSALEREAVMGERASDPELDLLILELERSLAPLTGAAGLIAPPEGLFDRIEQAMERERKELAGKTVLPFTEGKWHACLLGVEIKLLWSQKAMLLRCQPGATLPAHPHLENEHMIVISGDIVIGGRTLTPGDYHASPAGNHHGETHTIGGCVLFIQYVA